MWDLRAWACACEELCGKNEPKPTSRALAFTMRLPLWEAAGEARETDSGTRVAAMSKAKDAKKKKGGGAEDEGASLSRVLANRPTAALQLRPRAPRAARAARGRVASRESRGKPSRPAHSHLCFRSGRDRGLPQQLQESLPVRVAQSCGLRGRGLACAARGGRVCRAFNVSASSDAPIDPTTPAISPLHPFDPQCNRHSIE